MAKLFKYENGGREYTVDVDDNPDSWLIINDELYRPDRSAFILEKFNESFPHIDVKNDAKLIYSLCSRSSSLSEWLAQVNLEYASIQNEPTFYRDYIEPKRYEKVSKELTEYSRKVKLRAEEELKAAEEFRLKMDLINKKYSNIKFTYPESRVISMNTTELPLTLQLAIENYTPADDSTPNQRAYARETLINYKLTLIDLINSKDSSFDINIAIEANKLK